MHKKHTGHMTQDSCCTDHTPCADNTSSPCTDLVGSSGSFGVTIDAVKKTISFWQFASVVIKEGEESSIHDQFMPAMLQEFSGGKRRDKPLTKWQWYEFVEKKGASWKVTESCWEKTSTYERCGNIIAAKDEEFVPSAVTVPLKLLFRCDKQCSEKTLSCWQLVSVVADEGDEAKTTNLCQKCFNKLLQAKGEEPLTNVQWRQVVEKKAYRGRMWKLMEKEPFLRGMWEYFLQERSRVKRFRELADEEKQAGIQGQREQESPAREYLAQVKMLP